MASPKIEVFFLYSESTGDPLTGQVPTFFTYKDDLGANIAQPTISEIGGGAYKFTPVFADPDRGIVYVIESGAGAFPLFVSRFMRPEDWNTDDISVVTKITEGRWKIHTSGPDANRLVIYDDDGITPIKKFNLFAADGVTPTTTNPFERVPV